MAGIPLELILTGVGIVIPIGAALYEFLLIGRKRLGYRVQMDTTATDAVPTQYAGALRQLRQGEDGSSLIAPSFVLLRIENNGATNIDTSDYAVPDGDKVGIRVRFPGRTVAGMVITELSDDFVRHSLGQDGLNTTGDTIELPRVPLNRGAHYKVLAALDRGAEAIDDPTKVGEPVVIGGIKGGVKRGGIQETKSHTGVPRKAVYMIGFLVLVIVAQLLVSYRGAPPPMDCARGDLTITGSTAFTGVLEETKRKYEQTCDGATIRIETKGSAAGLNRLEAEGPKLASDKRPEELLAFSDGEKGEGRPMLEQRPIAFSLFTLVINQDAKVGDLSVRQIREIYTGGITNWAQVGGADLPIRLVSRYSNSGSRKTFEQQVLDGMREPGDTSDDCTTRAPGAAPGAIRCARGSTDAVLSAVAETPGAMGYSDLGTADKRMNEDNFDLVRIDQQQATLEGADYGAYPFWETEYAYTYGEPKADSMAASFMRYLTNELGKDIVRSHGHRPCAELANPVLCQPTEQP